MIENWEIVNRIDSATGSIHFFLLTDGTEQDIRLLSRKLKGYIREISPTDQIPYVYEIELPSDMDDGTQGRLRMAIEEGVSLSSKVNEFIPEGSLGDPLFHSGSLAQEDSFSELSDTEPATISLGATGNPLADQRPPVDLEDTASLKIALEPGVLPETSQPVNADETPASNETQPEETQLSTAAREVFATRPPAENAFTLPQNAGEKDTPEEKKSTPSTQGQTPPQPPVPSAPQPPVKKTSTISINDQDMLLKDMEHSLLGKMPLNDILSAQTKLDVFVDVTKPGTDDNPPQAQKAAPAAPAGSAADTFNVFEPELTETDDLDVEEIHAITAKITQKTMDFINKPNTPEETPQIPSAPQPKADASQPTPNPVPTDTPAHPAGRPISKAEQDSLPEITVRTANQPAAPQGPAAPEEPAQQPPAKTILHLRRPVPASEKTILRLRPKKQPTPAPEPSVAKPLRSTMSPERSAEISRLAKTQTIDHSIEIPISELKKHNWPLEVPLVPTYTMNNMIMSVNRFAHATAISVIENPGKLYNPLVLHGGTGTGKTHFLNALAYAFSQKFGQEHIFMTNGVRLSRGIQRYVMEGNIEKFEDFMESVKVLLIDDVHLLAINEQNREFVSKLLNSFLRNQKQIVITSKYPPESLAKLEELIKFKLDAGWISELKPATGVTHFRIVKKMLIENGVDLNDKQIEEFFGREHATLGTVTRSIRRLKVLENLIFPNVDQNAKSQAGIFEKLLATKGEDSSSELMTKDPAEITSVPMVGNGEWGRIGVFYPQNCSHMMNWIVYALGQRAKELGIDGGFEIVVRSSYATENIISSAFKIANLCDNKKLKGAIILGPKPDACDPSVRENFYDILTHMLEIMLIRCGIINYENVRLPSTYVKLISELMR